MCFSVRISLINILNQHDGTVKPVEVSDAADCLKIVPLQRGIGISVLL